MEKSPRLGNDQLPKNTQVPRDALLRGASPQEVIGALRTALESVAPTPRGVQFFLVRDEKDYRKIEQRWARIRKNLGVIRDSQIDRKSDAIRFMGDILVAPQTVSLLESPNILERVRGAFVVMHEWWHAARTEVEAFYPFEEGTADVFASIMAKRFFGVDISQISRPYQTLAQGIELIGQSFDDPEWFFASRQQANVKDWLNTTLLEKGYSTQAINRILRYIGLEDLWVADIISMLETR